MCVVYAAKSYVRVAGRSILLWDDPLRVTIATIEGRLI